MAQLSFSVTIPDDQVPRLVAALRYTFGQPNATTPQLVELVRGEVREKLVGIVKNYERIQARLAAEVIPDPVDVT